MHGNFQTRVWDFGCAAESLRWSLKFCVMLVTVIACAALARAQGGAQPISPPVMQSPAERASVAVPAPAASPATNPLRKAVEQRGFGACGARVEQVSNFVGFGQAAGAFLMSSGGVASASASDQRLLPLLMEIPLGPTSAVVSASFASGPAGGTCSATYDAIVYWPQGCEVVLATQFATLRRLGLLKRDVLVLDGGPATKVFLMMAGAGCISVKKELVY